MTPTDFGKALEFTLTDIVRIFKDNPNLCALQYVLDAVKAANAARAEHMDRTRADREIDQFASASAGGSGGVPNRQGIDVPVNTAQSQPTADVGAHGVPHIGCRYLCPVNGVCNKCGYIDHSGPAVDSQFLATPSNEGAGASAAGSVPLDEAISELNAAHSRLNIHQWNAYQAIRSHLAAQQAEIERLTRTAPKVRRYKATVE